MSDSQLAVHQIRGTWKVNAPHLQPLVREARRLLTALDGSIEWMARERNERADALTRQAYAQAIGAR